MSDSVRIRALIVDDEALARERIRDMLHGDPEIEVIGECANGREALETIKKKSPELVFLDIQMPGKNCLDILDSLGPDCIPAVIFVTAYDQYAVRAFEVHALDYLLKPFDQARFKKALERAKAQITAGQRGEIGQRIMSALEQIKTRPDYLERLVVKTNGRVFFVKTSEIDWLEAEGNYVRLHSGKESYLLRETITSLESQLDPKVFMRVHRSAIVNINQIQELQPWFHGEYRVMLNSGIELTLTRSYKDRLHELLGKSL